MRPWMMGLTASPLLDLDPEAFRAYRDGETETPPPGTWDSDSDPCALMMRDVEGEEVLCLAGGGGQQSVTFSLLGARVTVFDLAPEQLDRDEIAARHYGYEVTTIQGDIRDLSELKDNRFSRVFQPISTLYIPDLREVYQGVFRVLRPCGLYFADYVYPPLYMPENKGWDGDAYVLRFSQPHVSGKILERDSDNVMNFTEGVFFGEFNHLFSDIINGQIAEGFVIVGLWESPRREKLPPISDLTPGSREHQRLHPPLRPRCREPSAGIGRAPPGNHMG